ncbi:metallophosphoesterase [Virgibacillus phasianinus]|uniref:Metallophosphoesterase n=1 Tax=Virgibacillus phasianinus TaxID=2017483 RepID=A0A220U728_9BACI|nr:metallophosphoesterase [Virgibacillus phasianinus]ASK63651.1 metallophosphoesterase [Virgibacillus phasianinus]
MNRRSFLKKSFGSLLAFLGLGGGTYYYAREIEPSLLDIHEETISSDKVTSEFDNFKIVQFSDTHIGFHYSLSQLEELVQTINKQKPDLIVFTGDLVDAPNSYNWNTTLIRILKSLKATHGKYWIFGNHDHGGYGTNIVKNVMDQSGFKLLQNQQTTIKKGQESFALAGIDDVMLGDPNLEKTLKNADPSLFTILLAHEPDFADKTVDYPVDVQLSGHSHGGQVRLPIIGHLYTPLYAEKYVKGKYQLGQLILYVTKGVGTTRLPYRFLCEPEIYVFTLKATHS